MVFCCGPAASWLTDLLLALVACGPLLCAGAWAAWLGVSLGGRAELALPAVAFKGPGSLTSFLFCLSEFSHHGVKAPPLTVLSPPPWLHKAPAPLPGCARSALPCGEVPGVLCTAEVSRVFPTFFANPEL